MLSPTAVCVPVVVKVAVSSFTNPEMLPAFVMGSLSYTFVSEGVVTVSVAGLTVMLPSTYLMLSLFVTSTPFAFLITSSSQFAATVPSLTFVAVSLDTAFSNVYPFGSLDTFTFAP